MTGERWSRVRQIFERAVDLEPRERAGFVERACGGDPVLLAEVRRLLAGHVEDDVFLARPLFEEGAAARLLAEGADFETELDATVRFPRAAAALASGTVVGSKYRVEGLLGAGGMGAIYRATHLHLHRSVAVKVIRAEFLGNRALVERFERETRAVASLKHPHIVAVHDAGVDPVAGAYLVLELLEGRTLAAEIAERGRLPVAFAVELMWGVSSAAHAAHALGVVHRDLKPSNIFLEATPDGVVAKVLDFGIAKLHGADPASTPLTHAGELIGTVAYMAPEQCQGLDVDRRADVYSLGCILYEVATGRRPFVAESLRDLALKQILADVDAPRSLVPDLPVLLEALILRALAKDPADRFQSAGELAEALLSVPLPANASEPGGPDDGTVRRVAVPRQAGASRQSDTAGRDSPSTDGDPDDSPLDTCVQVPHNLPDPLTPFIGREGAVAEVLELLPKSRLLVLTGTGGVGKTRLSIAAALRALGDFPDGVWFVELAHLADPLLVAKAAASAVDVPEQSGRSTAESLAESLRAKRGLLIFDNCEHLLEACAALIVALLHECPKLGVLATSREPFGVSGERVWRVPSLDVPAADAELTVAGVMESEAVRLFVDRAGLVEPSFALTEENAPLVAGLCRWLDGIPLAIELAASRTPALSVRQILERLSDRLGLLTSGDSAALPRQQTLRATVDWSHDLLGDQERALFRRLSVFVGGWTLEAADAICVGEGIDASELLDLLTRLVKKSIVFVDTRGLDHRYRLLETIREYAYEKLVAAGEVPLLMRRHRDLYVRFAEEASEEIGRSQQGLWARRIEAEHDNLRAVLRRNIKRGDSECAVRVCVALGDFWLQHGHVREGRRWFELALGLEPRAPAAPLGRALTLAGYFARGEGDSERACALFEAALASNRAGGEKESECSSLYALARTLLDLGQYESAATAAADCLALARDLGTSNKLGIAADAMGMAALSRADFPDAARWFEEGLAVFRESGSRHNTAVLLFNLADVEYYQGALDRARAHYEEATAIAREVESPSLLTRGQMALGSIAAAHGHYAEAVGLQGEGLRVARDINSPLDIVFALEGIARTAADVGKWDGALRLAAAAECLRERAKVVSFPHEQADFERSLDAARLALTPEQVAEASAMGRAMRVDEAIEYALALGAEPRS